MADIITDSLVDQYTTPNPLRALSDLADDIEKRLGIRPVRAHLGNPTGPIYAPAIDAMIASLEERKQELEHTRAPEHADGFTGGYAHHTGDKRMRREVAEAVRTIDGLPEGALDENNTFACNAGTGGLNAVFAVARPGSVIFAPEPTYPAWQKIAGRYGHRIVGYPLNEADRFLPQAEAIKELMDRNPPQEGGTNIVLYHYPHNPSGKTLNESEARQVADTMKDVVHHRPNSLLVQEDIYLATTHPDDAIFTPSQFMKDEETLRHLVVIHSMSKMGHPQERTGVIAIPNRDVARYIGGAISFLTLGSSSTDFIGIARTLAHIAGGGLLPQGQSPDKENHRYKVAKYYQDRLQVISRGLFDLEKKLETQGIQPGHILAELNPDLAVKEGEEYLKRTPRGTYYLFPDFRVLKGQEIPQVFRAEPAMQEYFARKWQKIQEKAKAEGRPVPPGDTLPEELRKIDCADDIAAMLANAHCLGLRPLTVAPGGIVPGRRPRRAGILHAAAACRDRAGAAPGARDAARRGADPRIRRQGRIAARRGAERAQRRRRRGQYPDRPRRCRVRQGPRRHRL
ncbi:MAG: pyridoxal phosphate-dependent aminotransferase [Alphaproteobacteria bacterium]